MIFIGIDVGFEGGVAALDSGGAIVHLDDAPVRETEKGREMDGAAMRRLFDLFTFARSNDEVRVHIEKAMPAGPRVQGRAQGLGSTFKFGVGYGRWLGVLDALQIPYEEVTPQRWKKDMMDGKGKEKAAAVLRAQQLFPRAQLVPAGCRVPRDGRAEALLIAERNRRIG